LKEAYARSIIVEETAKTVLAGKVAGNLKCLSLREIEEVENMEAEDYRKALLKSAK
jgi:L-fuculose-phosphate aldolase